MEDRDKNHPDQKARRWKLIGFITIIVLGTVLFTVSSLDFFSPKNTKESIGENTLQNNDIVNGIHQPTGLKEGEGLMIVITHCTACHSAQLITQNRMNKERWNATIRWMQETQNLWELGDNQAIIVNYLVENYPIDNKGRRENLQDIQWYELTD